jgi:hypothetical protein
LSACNSGKPIVVRFRAWLMRLCAWFCSMRIWLLICSSVRAAVRIFWL